MAEQDFDIKIRIQADTAQVETIRRSFEQLGAQVEVTNRKAAAAATGAGAATGDAAALGRLIGGVTGVGIGAGLFQFVDGLKKASEEIKKISESLDKQGEQLLKNAQLTNEQARHATDAGDVIKITEKTLKDIEATQKTITELSQKELGYGAQFSDYLQKQMLSRQRAAGMGDYEAAQQENLRTAISQNEQARESAIREIDNAQEAQHRGINEIIADTERAIETEKRRAATARENLDAVTYAEAVNALNRYNQELEKSLKLREQLSTKTEKYVGTADPQVKAILANEKAMFEARAAGKEQDATMFERSAQALRRGARPEQLAELEKIYSSPVIVEALKQIGTNTRALVDLWK